MCAYNKAMFYEYFIFQSTKHIVSIHLLHLSYINYRSYGIAIVPLFNYYGYGTDIVPLFNYYGYWLIIQLNRL